MVEALQRTDLNDASEAVKIEFLGLMEFKIGVSDLCKITRKDKAESTQHDAESAASIDADDADDSKRASRALFMDAGDEVSAFTRTPTKPKPEANPSYDAPLTLCSSMRKTYSIQAAPTKNLSLGRCRPAHLEASNKRKSAGIADDGDADDADDADQGPSAPGKKHKPQDSPKRMVPAEKPVNSPVVGSKACSASK